MKYYFFNYTRGIITGIYTTSDGPHVSHGAVEVEDFELALNFFGIKQVDAHVRYNSENQPSFVFVSFDEMARRTKIRDENLAKNEALWAEEDKFTKE